MNKLHTAALVLALAFGLCACGGEGAQLPSEAPVETATPTVPATPTASPEATATPTPSPTPSPTVEPSPEATPEVTATPTPKPTPAPVNTPAATPAPTQEATAEPTQDAVNAYKPPEVVYEEIPDPMAEDTTPPQEGVVFQGDGESVSDIMKQLEEEFSGKENVPVWEIG